MTSVRVENTVVTTVDVNVTIDPESEEGILPITASELRRALAEVDDDMIVLDVRRQGWSGKFGMSFPEGKPARITFTLGRYVV